jgi:lysophospholipase L1-like esterase
MKKTLIYIVLGISLLINIAFIGRKLFYNKPVKSRPALTTKTFADLKMELFSACPNDSNEIIFLGNSLTSEFMVSEFFPELRIKNRGIAGNKTIDILNRTDEIAESKPSKVFIMAGINDLLNYVPANQIVKDYNKILDKILEISPGTIIYIQSILPVTHQASAVFLGNPNAANREIEIVNGMLRGLCDNNTVRFADVGKFYLKNGELNDIYSWDGLHINSKGYKLWYELIQPHVVE